MSNESSPKRPKTLARTITQWEAQIGSRLPKGRFHTDYVLVYKSSPGLPGSPDPELGSSKAEEMRKKFYDIMKSEGIKIKQEEHGNFIYLKIHVPFWRLCKEAERCRLEMPVKGFQTYKDEDLFSCWTHFVDKHLRTDDEVDFASSPLITEKLHLYENGEDADNFFRSSLRSFLAHLILIHLNMSSPNETAVYKRKKSRDHHLGLLYMLHKKYYSDAFILHDPTDGDRNVLYHMLRMKAMYGSKAEIEGPDDEIPDIRNDSRMTLNNTWSLFYKYQPLWRIRNYFGEMIGLYFAWCGILMTTLWIPMLFGIAVFFYGIYLSVTKRVNGGGETWSNSTDKATSVVEDSMDVIKESFDNAITPYFALFISIWGTVFLEVWKRTNYTLAYEWDVDSFETTETDRPEFVGTVEIPDPVIIGEKSMHSPFYRQCIKIGFSVSVLLVMICLVFIATAGIILYRIVLTVDYCLNMSPGLCFFATTIGSSLINAVVILILGKLYDWLAVKLTDWENHRTQTEYNDSLIIKLFAFQFANSYTSLFYIAFFRGRTFQDGIFGLGSDYRDTCGSNTCMAMLSFQVLILMLTKPIPKFLMDVVVPWSVYMWRKYLKPYCKSYCCCFRKNKVHEKEEKFKVPSFIEREHQKKDLGNFTLSEFTEKVIIYGFLMLFAASFPLAPLLAFLIILVDIRVDAKRMLWLYRRPIALIAQDIGMWYEILLFINIVGVVSNACLIAFTSKWGAGYDLTGKLLIIIVFEHVVFAVKFIIAACIPDLPSWVRLAIKREKYQLQQIFDNDMEDAGVRNRIQRRKQSEVKIEKEPSEKAAEAPNGRNGNYNDLEDRIRSNDGDSATVRNERNGGPRNRRPAQGVSENRTPDDSIPATEQTVTDTELGRNQWNLFGLNNEESV